MSGLLVLAVKYTFRPFQLGKLYSCDISVDFQQLMKIVTRL